MNVSIGERWQDFVERVVREGLRLVEEREAKLLALRATLDASIAQGGVVTDEEIDAALDERAAELVRQGYGG